MSNSPFRADDIEAANSIIIQGQTITVIDGNLIVNSIISSNVYSDNYYVSDGTLLTGSTGPIGATGPSGSGGGSNVSISNTAPTTATVGSLWLNTESGRLLIYYNDGDDNVWIQPAGSVGPTGSTGATGPAVNLSSTASNIIPASDSIYDLGTSSLRWRDLYLSGNTIDLGGTAIKNTANGISFTDSTNAIVAVGLTVSSLKLSSNGNVVTLVAGGSGLQTVDSSGNTVTYSGGTGAQYATYNYTADGVQTTYAAIAGITVDSILVTVDGVVQTPTTSYTVSGSSVVFVVAPPTASLIQIRILGDSGGGTSVPKITAVQITDSSYVAIDDTAISTAGGYVVITGTGFVSGCQVLVDDQLASSVTFISATTVRAQLPARAAGTYTLYLTNTDGGVAIRVNAVNYSSTPTWTTTGPLSAYEDVAVNIQLLATSNSTVSYSLQAGSTLPSGLTLTSGGLLSGTVTGIENDTTYNFTVVAVDLENQDTPRAFSITISIGDPLFGLTTLLLPGTGTNGAQNNTFLDGSTNNFTITRNGNATQGTFSPFSQTGWGNYFPGASSYITFPYSSGLVFGTNDFCVEFWMYWIGGANENNVLMNNASGGFNIRLVASTSTNWSLENSYVGPVADFGTAPTKNVWHHIAITRNSGTLRAFIDGVQVYSGANSTNFTNTATWYLGANGYSVSSYYVNAYISNLRIVVGSPVYTSAFTLPTSPLTAITNTQLLTCQSNRFVDNSSSPKTLTVNGSPSVQAFSPFNPTAPWSATTNGGSGYFDGSGDFLTAATNSAVLDSGSGTITVEAWVYLTTNVSGGAFGVLVAPRGTSGTSGLAFGFVGSGGTTRLGVSYVAVGYSGTLAVPLNAWTHVAYVLTNATTCKTYLNGVLDATFSLGGTQNVQGLCVAAGDTGASPIVGYISNLRVVKNVTVYTANFTPPTAPVTAIANTSLLLNFTNAGIYDATGRNDLETVGGAQISTAQSKFGGSSMAFDGSGDWLKSPANIFIEGTEAFTVECWINLSNVSSTKGIIVGLGSNSFGLRVGQSYLGNVNGLNIVKSGVSDLDYCSFTFATSTWYHIAVCRSGTTIYFFVNGQQQTTQGSGAGSFSFTKPTSFYVGCNNDTNENFAGYLQDLRVTKGYARYTSNFTVPASQFPPK
jgi:hypothetical protein